MTAPALSAQADAPTSAATQKHLKTVLALQKDRDQAPCVLFRGQHFGNNELPYPRQSKTRNYRSATDKIDQVCENFLEDSCSLGLDCPKRHCPSTEEEASAWRERHGGKLPCPAGTTCSDETCKTVCWHPQHVPDSQTANPTDPEAVPATQKEAAWVPDELTKPKWEVMGYASKAAMRTEIIWKGACTGLVLVGIALTMYYSSQMDE